MHIKNLEDITDGTCMAQQIKRLSAAEVVKLSEENLRKQRQMKVPMAKSEKDFEVPREKLDAWEMTELRAMVTDTAEYDKKLGNCGIEGLREALEMMILCGRIATTHDIDAFIEGRQLRCPRKSRATSHPKT